MDFDIDGARKAGYSDEEIADHLGQVGSFDVAGARAAGYSDAEIVGHIIKPDEPQKPGRYTMEQAGKDLWHGTKLAGRSAANAIASMPLAFADFGTGVFNLATGDRRQSPSVTWNEGVTQMGLPEPQGALQKGADIIAQGVLGTRLPIPTKIPGGAPVNFVPKATLQQQALRTARADGYVVPPTTTNPSATNKVLEGMAGKITTAQQASAKNQAVTTRLAKDDLGIAGDLTLDAIKQVRTQAAQAYGPVRNIGTMRADAQFSKDLSKVGARFESAAKDFPDLANSEVLDVIQAVNKKSFDSNSAIDATILLRDKATAAAKQGDKSAASSYRAISKAVEDAIERSIARRGKDAEGILKDFREGRKMIAKTHSVEKALNPATGNVSATKLAQQLQKGAPLSGGLRRAANFGTAFPKASREFNESLPGFSPLDVYAAGGIGAASGSPLALLYPMGRNAIRHGLLSPTGQRLATPTQMEMSPEMARAVGAGLLGP